MAQICTPKPQVDLASERRSLGHWELPSRGAGGGSTELETDPRGNLSEIPYRGDSSRWRWAAFTELSAGSKSARVEGEGNPENLCLSVFS